MKKGKSQPFNLSELKPRRLYPCEFAEKGRIVVLVPQQQNKFVQWFMPKKNTINDRIKLDILGSFVWNSCDGTKTIHDIAERMKQEYGKYAEPVDERVSRYINKLHDSKLIDVSKENIR